MKTPEHPLVPRVLAEGSVLFVLVLWWAASLRMPAFVLPSPGDVGRAMLSLFVNPDFNKHVAASVLRLMFAIALAMMLGGALAQLARSFGFLEWVVMRRILPFLNSFPSMGWAVLAVLWFGVSTTGVVFVEVAILLPFALINLAAGLQEIDSEIVEMGRSFTRSRWRALTRIYLPLLMPYIVATLRMSYGIGWKIALVAELFGAEEGLGFLMVRAQYNGQSDTVFATCLTIVLIFIVGEKLLIDPLARRFGQA
ncbi:ABC transporter permease [Ramlibacter sp.]|uniref:ABC transporter permease n=1 Tax=Ramlibacter sp. TaxID=1917967 RepID=UPI003D13658F